jgi:hypothetical protein
MKKLVLFIYKFLHSYDIGIFIVNHYKNYNNFIRLAFLLEDIFQRKVDLLTIDALNPYMKPKIMKEPYFESI